jgi:hypothetical protein
VFLCSSDSGWKTEEGMSQHSRTGILTGLNGQLRRRFLLDSMGRELSNGRLLEATRDNVTPTPLLFLAPLPAVRRLQIELRKLAVFCPLLQYCSRTGHHSTT